MPSGLRASSSEVFKRMLRNLDVILDKADAWVQAKKIDPSAVLLARLAPDMFHLTRQVQAVTDQARNLARVVGREAPKFDNVEASIGELKARIGKTIAYLDSLPADEIDAAAGTSIGVPMGGQTLQMTAADYVNNWLLPNFYFHLTAAYAILRHNGLEIGKRDFLGLR